MKNSVPAKAKRSTAIGPTDDWVATFGFDKRPIPQDVVDAFLEIRKAGRGEVRGIHFDISPGIHDPNIWATQEPFGLSMGGDNGPFFKFPWENAEQYLGKEQDWVEVKSGDAIFVKSFVEEEYGDELEHISDKVVRKLTICIKRGETELQMAREVTLFRRGTFQSNWGIHYDAVLARALESVGAPDIYDDIWDDEIPNQNREAERAAATAKLIAQRKHENVNPQFYSYAETAIEAAREVDIAVDFLFQELGHQGSKKAQRDTSVFQERIMELLQVIMDESSAVGYFQARSEAAPFAPFLTFGRSRSQQYKEGGGVLGAPKKALADIWRVPGRPLAEKLRREDPEATDIEIATRMMHGLDERGIKTPEIEAVLKEHRAWRKDGFPPRRRKTRSRRKTGTL